MPTKLKVVARAFNPKNFFKYTNIFEEKAPSINLVFTEGALKALALIFVVINVLFITLKITLAILH